MRNRLPLRSLYRRREVLRRFNVVARLQCTLRLLPLLNILLALLLEQDQLCDRRPRLFLQFNKLLDTEVVVVMFHLYKLIL